MQTKNSIISVVVCFFFLLASCTANIKRQGYTLDDSVMSGKDCSNIVIVKNLEYDPGLVEIVGKIAASDTGFATKCSETFVIDNFKKDACTLGADVINITEDSHPDFWSTCYRAEAEYLRVKDRGVMAGINSDEQYSAQNISKQSEYTECLNKGAVAAGAAGGLIGSLIWRSICKSHVAENDQTGIDSAFSSDQKTIENK